MVPLVYLFDVGSHTEERTEKTFYRGLSSARPGKIRVSTMSLVQPSHLYLVVDETHPRSSPYIWYLIYQGR